jgi:DNA-binding transcriptional LysR family regulator
MQPPDWNDLRYVLAIHRGRSFAGAARLLSTDPTTVARRLRTLEEALAVKLFARGSEGRLDPTEAGEGAVERAEAIEEEVGRLTASVGGGRGATGTVRVTAVPVLVNRVLIPAARHLLTGQPGVTLELISDARDLNLTRREADIAVRLAAPGREVGSRIVAQRIGSLRYAAYVASHIAERASKLPWLTYDSSNAHLPQARWTARTVERGGTASRLLVNDAEAVLQAVLSGSGRALLPCLIADRLPALTVLPDSADVLSREIWLLSHPDLRPLARVAATLDWLRGVLCP